MWHNSEIQLKEARVALSISQNYSHTAPLYTQARQSESLKYVRHVFPAATPWSLFGSYFPSFF